jgi:hypothetical protein
LDARSILVEQAFSFHGLLQFSLTIIIIIFVILTAYCWQAAAEAVPCQDNVSDFLGTSRRGKGQPHTIFP